MEIIYTNNVVTDAITGYAPLQARLTQAERLAMFGIAAPDAVLWGYMRDLENGTAPTTIADAVNRMVTIGAITQDRADAILA